MRTTYSPEDDVLVIRLSEAPVARIVLQSWHVNVS